MYVVWCAAGGGGGGGGAFGGVGRAREGAVLSPGAGCGDQLLRYGECLFDWRQRARAGTLSEGACEARRHRDRDQAEWRDARWAQWRRVVAQRDFLRAG